MIASIENDYRTAIDLCELLQRGPGELQRAIEALHLVPPLRLSGRDYWTAAQADQLAAHFREAAK